VTDQPAPMASSAVSVVGRDSPAMVYIEWSGRAEWLGLFLPIAHLGAGPPGNKGWEELRTPAAHGVLVGVGSWLSRS